MAGKSPFTGRIKIFLDGADRASMVEMASNPLVAGFTTNPSLIKKAGVKDYETFCRDILKELKGKPVSFEVFADDFAEMKRQAMKIKSWETPGTCIYVKIPVMNSKGEATYPLIRELSHQGIKLNVTAVYTVEQVREVCNVLKGGAPSFVSVFAGRTADTGRDPMPIMQEALKICQATDKNIELLWASTREAFNIVQADVMGCHIITAPGDLIKKISNFGKDLMEVSLDTVKTFKADSEAAGFTL